MSSTTSSAASDASTAVRLCITLPTVDVDQRGALDEIHAPHSPSRTNANANANNNNNNTNDHHAHWPAHTKRSINDMELEHDTVRAGSPWVASVATLSLPTAVQLNALQELEAARLNSALNPARKRDPTRLPCAAASIAVAVECRGDRREAETLSQHTAPLIGGLKAATSPVRVERRLSFQAARAKQQKRPSPISYAPETLPSVFQHAKPRVYKSLPRNESPASTRHVAVVTTTIAGSDSTEVDGHGESTSVDVTTVHQQHQHAPNHKTHVAVVTLTDDDVAERLMLDFQAAHRKIPCDGADGDSSHGDGHNQRGVSAPKWIAWALLDSDHQSVELMAATRSRSVVAAARADDIAVPPAAAFSHSIDVKTQLTVRSFTRWFLATQHSQQRIREAFLREELRFAARDPSVMAALRRAGCAAPFEDCVDHTESRERTDFTVWYATGRPYPVEDHFVDHDGLVQLHTERLHDRVAYLRRRLAALGAYDKYAASTQPPCAALFVFDSLPIVHDTSAADALCNWDKLGQASQAKELAVALSDPIVQIAAMADEIVLPDASVADLLPHCDLLTLAAPFIAWWTDSENIHRQEFLAQEIHDASADSGVLEILHGDASQEEAENPVQKMSFMDGYFAATSAARVSFLAKKLEQIQRNGRVAAIAQQGHVPDPILFAAPLTPLLVAFDFPPLPRATQKTATVVERFKTTAVSGCLAIQRNGPEETHAFVAVVDAVDDDAASRRRRKDELLRMEAEDALSFQLRLEYESASDDEQDVDLTPLESPKRTDFSFSYFFGSLPKSYRVNGGGWLAGSGIDNGDEEIEEEERLERERKHQENLDRLEADRLAELEREAERQRLEKEMDEKSLQLRRLRQVELKKILLHQAELEQQRAVQDAEDRTMRERSAMAQEEHAVRVWLQHVVHERAAMEVEDRLIREITKATRDARRTEMRRVLAELTLMDMEDRRSAAAQTEQFARERKQRQRVECLAELYEPFEPYYAASRVPSEEMLPVIRYRLDRQQRQPSKRLPNTYAMSFAEAVATDEVDEEQHYVARDSRKLRQLLGLPVTTPQSRRMMRIPSAQEIIKTRQELQLMLPPSGDLADDERRDRARSQTRAGPAVDQYVIKTRLPELVRWKSHKDDGHRLSDLSGDTQPPTNQHSTMNKTTFRANALEAASSASLQRQRHTALPFSRGNFLIEGKSRAQAYAPQTTASN